MPELSSRWGRMMCGKLTTKNKFDESNIPPYTDAQMQIENRELKAQIARQAVLLEEAQALSATLWGALKEQMKWVSEIPPGDLDFDMMDEYRYAVAQSKAALRDTSPVAEAAGRLVSAAVLERVRTIEFVDALHDSGLEEMDESEELLRLCGISNGASLERAKAVDAYRALLDGKPENTGDFKRRAVAGGRSEAGRDDCKGARAKGWRCGRGDG